MQTTASMVTVFASRVVARGFEPRSGQANDYKIGICCLATQHTELKSRNKDWCTQNYTSQPMVYSELY